jgi:putative nucleotidyltransferase with HDIG domain
VELEITRLCELIGKGLVRTNHNLINLEAVCAHLPGLCKLVHQAGYQYLRVYQINDFLAVSGYWLMYFRSQTAAIRAGDEISSSLSSPQFRETFTEQLFASTKEEALDEVISSWVTLLDKRDKETEEHTRRVAKLAVRLAVLLGMDSDAIKNVHRGALLHDVGKIVIPDEILYKRGALTESEWQVMQLHPKIVRDLLKNFNIPDDVLEIPLAHHERWDGSGYPNRLKGEEIPLSARIFSVVDVWDAMLVDRPYRSKFPRCQVIDYIREQIGRHFDPMVAEMFLSLTEAAT